MGCVNCGSPTHDVSRCPGYNQGGLPRYGTGAAPFQYPGQGAYDPSGVLRNPGHTVPFPQPSDVPIPYWTTGPWAPVWANGAGQVIRTATWETPIFDMRPELRGAAPNAPQNVQPIWRGSGGGQLFMWFNLGTNSALLGYLNVTALEFAHPFDPGNCLQVTTPEDVTAGFTADQPATHLEAIPIGGGYPIRYWKYTLTFDIVADLGADPVITVSAAFY